MGGKPSGKQYISNGERPSVKKKILNANRREYLQSPDRWLNQQKALAKGKDVVLTMPNPNKNETNKRFIKMKVNGKQYVKARTVVYKLEAADVGE